MRIQQPLTLMALAAGSMLAAGALIAGPALAAPTAAGAQALTGTTTTLSVSPPIGEFGQESAIDLTVTVTPNSGSGTPTGMVEVVEDGQDTACSAPLPAGRDTVTCHLANNIVLPPHGYSLTASYNGDANFSSSASNAQALIIGADLTSTTLTLPASTLAVNEEAGTQLSYQIAPETVVPTVSLTGTVTFTTGSTVICSSVVTGPDGSCALASGELAPGSYPVIATYSGDDPYGGSASDPQTLTITSTVKTTTTLSLSARTVRFGHEGTEKLSVHVKSGAGRPSGHVTLKTGSARVCRIALTAGQGTCRLKAKRLRPGTYHLVAVYAAVGSFAGSTSAKKTLTVTK